MMRISQVILLCLIFTFSASSQIKTANFESGLFQIVGPEISSGDYSSLALGFDVKKAQAAIGFNYVRASYSETDYEIVELHSSADFTLYQNNRLVFSGGVLLAFKVLSQQSFMNNTFKSSINSFDIRPYIDISYEGQIVSPYLRGYRGLLNLETSDSEAIYFVNQQIALGLKWQIDKR
jgi:hypothetical protein